MKITAERILARAMWGITALALGVPLTESFSQTELWEEVSPALSGAQAPDISPAQFRVFRVDQAGLSALLDSAPEERSGLAPVSIAVPQPDGRLLLFAIRNSPIMAPGLATRYPEIQTYTGQGIDDPRMTARFDRTRRGFHAIIFSPSGTVFIDPVNRNTPDLCICYYARDLRPSPERTMTEEGPLGTDSENAIEIRRIVGSGTLHPLATGEELRTYRTAVAATGEYTQFHGGTVEDGMAAIVTAMNRVDGVYELEVAVRMVLIDNNDLLVYTNPVTDPYTNDNGGAMLGQNQATIDAVIGSANYDIGHVFSTGGGGVAYLGVVCNSSLKAGGVTGLNAPIGDPFYIDYVAHEMGHQFGGNHTFNGTSGSCGGGNRNGSTAYEPGSGSTIMAYAGICGGNNIQDHSDPYFHGISLDEIIAYTQLGGGNSCPVITTTGNMPPVADAGTTIYTIPLETPFHLAGSGSDIDGDSLTYCWEEFDLGPGGDPNNPSGNAPIFRSFNPMVSPARIFPQLSDILGGIQTTGEILPTYGRTLNFRLTVRDNRAGGGGTGDDQTSVVVSGTAGPFQVTYPNEPTVWIINSTDSVTWDVANTDMPPISCTAVNILLSTDGGVTFPDTLAAGTPNDGSEAISVPPSIVTNARVKVESIGNIFFDIGNSDILISDLGTPALLFPADSAENTPTTLDIGWNSVPSATSYHVQVSLHVGFVFGRVVDDSMYVDTTRTVEGLDPNHRYYWRVRARNENGDGLWSEVRTFVTAPATSVPEGRVLPTDFSLEQNFPNPFNPTTTIRYAIPEETDVHLEVFNPLGEKVAVLVDGRQSPGYYEVAFGRPDFASGIFLYRLTAGGFVETKKLVLLR